jgi:hypothetical protein
MAAHWYCLIGLQQYGPFTGEQIQQLVQQGQLQREHGVRTETDSQWTAAGDLPGLFPALQAAPAPPTAPTVTTMPKRKPSAPGVPVPPYSQPATPAPAAVPSATPVMPPGSAVPSAAPAGAAPVAMPVHVVPVTAAPVASAPGPATAIPVAAAPVALATASRAQGGSAPARPVSAARPLPLNSVVPPAPTAGTARATSFEEAISRRRHASRKKSQMLVGGLGTAMLLLIVVVAIVMNRSPGNESGRTTALSKGASGDPEIETGGITAANAEPADPADPVPPIALDSKAAVPEAKLATLPDVSRWLEATRQKGGIKNVVRLGVGNAWLDSVDGKPKILNVEIEITNLSPDTPLDFAGWRPEVQPQTDWRAVMADDAQALLAAAPPRGAANRRAARRRIAPGQSEIEQLSFLLPDGDAQQFRLALPYAALGQMGHLGFELPRQMIKDKPPGAEEPATQGPAKVASETLPAAAGAIQPEPGEPKTLGDLRTEIERSGEGRMEFMTDPSEPLAEEPPPNEPPPNEPEKIPDIRKLIEEEDPKMESTNEEPPSEESPVTEPKSP